MDVDRLMGVGRVIHGTARQSSFRTARNSTFPPGNRRVPREVAVRDVRVGVRRSFLADGSREKALAVRVCFRRILGVLGSSTVCVDLHHKLDPKPQL